MVNRNGRWYVAGQDTDRGAERVFRLSRIEGPVSFTGPPGAVVVPEGADVRGAVETSDYDPPEQRAGDAAGAQRPRARAAPPRGQRRARRAARLGHHPVPYTDTGWWSEHLASFGADVIVLDPPDLREAVISG